MVNKRIEDRVNYFTRQSGKDRVRSRDFRVEALICLCLVFVTLSTYWQVRQHDFIDFDDDIYVTSNRYVRDGLTLDGLKWSWGTNNENRTYWHPLTWLSHMSDVQMFGVNAGYSLMINVFLHILNSLLLFFVLRRWTTSVWPAAIVAALFSIHPIGVESVAWVAARKNLLSSLFWILTLLTYGCYAARPAAGRYLAVILCFTLGLLAKPMLVTLPFVLLLMDYWPLGRLTLEKNGNFSLASLVRLVIEKSPLLVLSAFSISLSMSSLEGHNSFTPYGAVPIGLRIGNALVSYIAYIGKLFWPLELSVYYPYPKDIPLWQPAGASLILMGVTWVVWRLRRERPFIIVGWLWYLGTLLPVIGLVQAGLWPAMADRFAYIPFIGLYIIIGWGSVVVFGDRLNQRIFGVLFASLMILLAARAWQQVTYWENSLTIFGRAIELDEGNIIAHNNIGKSLIESGHVSEAVKHYEIALNHDPNYASAHISLGYALSIQGKTDDSVSHLQEALRINPNKASAHYFLGNILSQQDRLQEAIRHYGKAIELKPEYFEAHNNLANLLADQGRLDDAVRHYKKVLLINPRYAKAYNNLGSALFRKNRVKEAVHNYGLAINYNPDYAEAHNNLGVALKKQGQLDEAVIQYQRALQLMPQYGEAHFNLGLALAYTGDIETAAIHFEEALRIKPDDVQIKHHKEKTQVKLDAINADIETLKALATSHPVPPDVHINLGDLFKKKGDIKSATAHYSKALVHNRRFVPALKKLGIIYATEGQFDEAIHVFKEIAKLEPKNSEACYWLAGLFAVQKQTDNSVNWLEIAVNRGFSDWDRVKNDPKFRSIRGTSYYKKMIKQLS
jgi:tetratricopeptide (TPR) repeat protein